MKRNRDEKIARLAFEEMDSHEELHLRAELDRDLQEMKALNEYSELRKGLKQLSNSVPQCEYSVERMRDAILNQNLKTSHEDRNRWTWLWVPIAAGVFVFAFMSNRQPQQSPIVMSAGPSAASTFGSKSTSSPFGNLTIPTIPTVINDNTMTTPVSRSNKKAKPIETHRSPVQNSATPSIILAMGPKEPPRGGNVASRTKGPDKKSPTVTENNADPIVLVHSDTDDMTGAQSATEVTSVANVVIGG